jgi:hypothetical protein
LPDRAVGDWSAEFGIVERRSEGRGKPDQINLAISLQLSRKKLMAVRKLIDDFSEKVSDFSKAKRIFKFPVSSFKYLWLYFTCRVA